MDVANGDFEERIVGIRESGDVGDQLRAISEMIDRTDAFVRAAATSMDYVSQGEYFRCIIKKRTFDAILSRSKVMNAATDAMGPRSQNSTV